MKSAASNLAKLKPNLEWASLPLFDRTRWKRVRFGDVVENCAETCDPAEAGLERFIAMEHLEPGSLHIRSWGNVADGTTFTRRCRPGQVLFGKRRAYQRKVAVAEFEAVVSGDIYVLAPKDTRRLLPELLPFLCLSERFFQHAVGTSAGSLSPRTNWTSLASFEFDLPPLDQQRRIAEILWAVDEVIGLTREALTSVEQALGAVKNVESVAGMPNKTIGECCVKIGSGKTPRGGEKVYSTEGVLFLRSQNVHPDGMALEDAVFISPEIDEEMRSTRVRTSDVLLNITGASIGRCTVYDIKRLANVNQHVCILRTNPEVALPKFLASFLQSDVGQKMIASYSTKGNREGLNFAQLSAIPICIPSIERQQVVCDRILSLEESQAAERTHLASCKEISNTLLKSLFHKQ